MYLPDRIPVAPSGFKESLDAVEVADAIAAGVRRALPGVRVTALPVPDGGEGTGADVGREGRPSVSTEDAILLGDWLREAGITSVDVVGIATDHCVRATALDAVAHGFGTRVLLDLTAGVSPQTTTRALATMREAGVELVGNPRAS